MIIELEAVIRAEKRLRELNRQVLVAEAAVREFQHSYTQSLRTLYGVLDEPDDLHLVHVVDGQAWLLYCTLWDGGDTPPITLTPVKTAHEESFKNCGPREVT